MLLGLSSYGQTFLYSYADPCTNEIKMLTYDMSTPIVVSYYGQTRAFTSNELQTGAFESWLNEVYAQHLNSPCQGVLAQQTATTYTNLTTSVIQNVMNLTTLTDLGSIAVDVGGNVNDGSSGMEEENKEGKNEKRKNKSKKSTKRKNKKESKNSESVSSSSSSSSGSQSGEESSSGSSSGGSGSSSGSSSSGSSGSSGSSNGSGSSGSGSNGSNSGSGSSSGSSESGGSGNGGSSGGGSNGGSETEGTGNSNGEPGVSQGNTQKGGSTSKEKVQEIKNEQRKASAQQTAKSASKAKTNTKKPAILVTGDIVGLQKTDDRSNDARATLSYTRVKGDGTASIGVSADYMINARIGNITLMKSWIGVNEKGNKHINLISSGFSLQPDAWSNTTMFIRVNSMKRLTAIYGVAGSYGLLYEEPMTSTLAIGGFMYKGVMLKKIEATIIVAGIYSPYTKYYTESWWDNKPVAIPFFNFNYKITKTFGLGITGGGTYLAGENVLNYQVLLGAKLIL